MSRLTQYTVRLFTERDSATTEITAPSPELALDEARAIAADPDRLARLQFEPYPELFPVEDIIIENTDGQQCAHWHAGELRLRLAAPDLLAALKDALKALNTAPRFRVACLDTDSYQVAAACGRAIDKAATGPGSRE
jgi:hypothetical protein